MRRIFVPVVIGALAAGSAVAIAAPAEAATTLAVTASYQLNTSQGPQQRPLDPASQTDVTSGNTLISLAITNNDTETYTLDSVTPTTPANVCSGTIAPGATLDCYVSPTFASGTGVLDLTLTGSFPTAGADTTVVSYPYFGVDYLPVADDFAAQAPPPATGWLTTIPDPQLLTYPGLFRPLIRLSMSWGGNTPVTITRATAALAPVSDQCFGTLPKVVNPGDPILSCEFPIWPGNNSWGFQYTGHMGEQQAYTGFLSYMQGGSCTPDQQRYAGGETITVTCQGMAAGVSAQMRVWDVGVTPPQTIGADGTAVFAFALPTITTGFPSGALIFSEGTDPASSGSAGPTLFAIDPGVASGSGTSTTSGLSGTTELADSGSDAAGPAGGALLAILAGLALLLVHRRRSVSN